VATEAAWLNREKGKNTEKEELLTWIGLLMEIRPVSGLFMQTLD
jgi:hypothetical protein